jgi:hypothetical protein
MTSPRDGEPDDGSQWREPSHLGEEPAEEPAEDRPNFADRRRTPRESDHSADRLGWQPPGWDLPDATPERGSHPRGTLFGSRSADPEMTRAFTDTGDPFGAQAWALQQGWTVTDGSGAEDAVLQEVLAASPVRPGKEARPGGVLRGRAGAVELVAFDVVYPVGRGWVSRYAVTAAPLLGTVPRLRLSPARLWKHGTSGLMLIPSGNDAFDTRWSLLAAEDEPRVRRLAQDPAVQGLLLGTDDGDEFWTAAGHVAAVRPDGHRPQLIEHHARLLTAVLGALAAGY